MISKELREVFAQAVGYAKTSRHEYLTIEHIFLMLLKLLFYTVPHPTRQNFIFNNGVLYFNKGSV